MPQTDLLLQPVSSKGNLQAVDKYRKQMTPVPPPVGKVPYVMVVNLFNTLLRFKAFSRACFSVQYSTLCVVLMEKCAICV